MNELIACCGLNCETCDARIATINNDNALREKTARLWSKLNHISITAEQINCMGCRTDGPKTEFCSTLCPIRQCCIQKGLATCGSCPHLDSCEKAGAVLQNSPEAHENLKHPAAAE